MERLRAVLSPTQVLQLQDRVEEVEADEAIVDYLMTVVERTRASPGCAWG